MRCGFFRVVSFTLLVSFISTSASSAFALKTPATAESAGLEELKQKFREVTNAAGFPLPQQVPPLPSYTTVASPLSAGLEEGSQEALLRVVVADEMDETRLGMKGVVNVSSLPKEEKIKRIIALKPQVLIVRGTTQVDKSLIDHLPDLRDVIRGGHGTDEVDTAYAQSKRIRVRRSEGSEDSVAALAMRMVARARAIQTHSEAEKDEAPPALFTLHGWMQAVEKKMKKVPAADQALFERKANELFRPISQATLDSLKGQRLGIIGFGTIGKQIAAVAKGLGMDVQVHAPSLEADPTPAQRLGVLFATKEEIYRSSRYIVLITGLYRTGPRKNAGMIDGAAVEAMLENKELIALVNPDREKLVDEEAIRRLMTEGKVQYWVDEAPKDGYLREHSIYTNHIGASTIQAEGKVVTNVAAILGELSAEARTADAAGPSAGLRTGLEEKRVMVKTAVQRLKTAASAKPEGILVHVGLPVSQVYRLTGPTFNEAQFTRLLQEDMAVRGRVAFAERNGDFYVKSPRSDAGLEEVVPAVVAYDAAAGAAFQRAGITATVVAQTPTDFKRFLTAGVAARQVTGLLWGGLEEADYLQINPGIGALVGIDPTAPGWREQVRQMVSARAGTRRVIVVTDAESFLAGLEELGLPPAVVDEATQAYYEAQDHLGRMQ